MFLNWLDRTITTLGVTFTIILSIWVFYTVGPWLESNYFPVTSKITFVEKYEDKGRTIFRFQYEKKRQCEFNSFEWFSGRTFKENHSPKKMGSKEVTSNPSGETYISSMWVIDAPIDETFNDPLIVWWHQCHPFWETKTIIYP